MHNLVYLSLSKGINNMTKIHIDYLGNLHTRCTHEPSGATIETDAPTDNGGKGEAFSPTDLFATSLGSCILTIMGLAAKKIPVDLKGISADVEKLMIATPERRVGKLIVNINCSEQYTPEVQYALEEAAKHCPVHKSLHPDIELDITFKWK